MASKFDRLRAGDVVEIEPGRKGRLNLQDKTFETSDGRKMFVGNDPDFFPSNEEALTVSREKEGLERQIKSTPAGEFLYQFGNQGLAGSAKDWVNKLIQKGDDYQRTKMINADVSQKISERSPWTSAGATAASFIPDIALTRGMSATRAAPALTALHAGPRIIEEPTEVAGEAALSAAGGFLIDKGAKALSKIAERRRVVRGFPAQQQAVKNNNILGKQAVDEANLQQKQAYNILKQDVQTANEARLQKYQQEINERQNRMLQNQNDFATAKSARDAEVVRLKNEYEMAKAQRNSEAARLEGEYKAAKQNAEMENKRFQEQFRVEKEQYEKALSEIPNMEKAAQAEYSSQVVKNAEKISDAFPKDARIYSSQFGTNQFIEEAIQKSGRAGSKEGNQASRILKSILPEGEILTSKELSSRYKAIEDAIQRSSPEVREILNEFKENMGGKLNGILADNMAYSRVVPSMKKQIQREVDSVLDTMGLAESGLMSRSFLKKRAETNLNEIFRELTPEDFLNKFQRGDIKNQVFQNILTPDDFTVNLGSLKGGKKPIRLSPEDAQKMGITITDPARVKYDEFSNLLSSKLDKAIAKAELKMIAVDYDATKKLGGKVAKTYGTAPPVERPIAPNAPESVPPPSIPEYPPLPQPNDLPPPVAPPQALQMPAKPELMGNPTQPIPQSFIPQPEPILPPSEGMSGMAGDLLEKKLLGGGGNPLSKAVGGIGKLAGLRYALGGAALPAELAYGAMKGLTSPTALGEAARMTFKQGGIQAIDAWARKYPSYHDGILENPQERRSLTKEIENASDIPIEQKAVLQSKINRGKPLSGTL